MRTAVHPSFDAHVPLSIMLTLCQPFVKAMEGGQPGGLYIYISLIVCARTLGRGGSFVF
jgi:hypothetical protein